MQKYKVWVLLSSLIVLSGGVVAQNKVVVIPFAGDDAQVAGSRYIASGGLNTGPANVTDIFGPIGPSFQFSKSKNDTVLEVFLNSRVSGGTFGSGTFGVLFELRVDGVASNIQNRGAVLVSNSTNFVSIMAVFENLSAGEYIIQTYARSPNGTSVGAFLDPGGWGGRIIGKETN